MKISAKFFSFFVLNLMLFGCGGNDDGNARMSSALDLKAAIWFTCDTEINFEDLEENVYGYRADAFFTVPSVQAGGHDTVDEANDLGVNLFFDLGDLNRENYTINSGSIDVGTAYVFYTRGTSEYISTDNNTDVLVVQELQLALDGTVESLICRFNEIEVANIANPDEKFCISSFELKFFN